jgi:hypothetical protein
MSLPGFTADVSLYTSPQHYRTATTFNQASRVLSPAISPSLVLPAACDRQCLSSCQLDCSFHCEDLPRSAKVACIRRCLNECRVDCGCRPRF